MKHHSAEAALRQIGLPAERYGSKMGPSLNGPVSEPPLETIVYYKSWKNAEQRRKESNPHG